MKNTKTLVNWWRGGDLNSRPSGYEPDELPGCSTPRSDHQLLIIRHQLPTSKQLNATDRVPQAVALPLESKIVAPIPRELMGLTNPTA